MVKFVFALTHITYVYNYIKYGLVVVIIIIIGNDNYIIPKYNRLILIFSIIQLMGLQFMHINTTLICISTMI